MTRSANELNKVYFNVCHYQFSHSFFAAKKIT
jgi:hypothetical protein